MLKSDLRSIALFLILAFALVLVWLSIFPLAPAFDLSAVLFEGAAVFAAIFGFTFIVSLRIRALTVGWILFSAALLVHLLHDLTQSSEFWDATISNLLKMSGLLIVAVGLFAVERERQRNIARARQDQEQLEKSRAQYQDLYENAADAIFTLDLAGNFVSANRATTLLLGYSTEEIRAKNIAEVLTPASFEDALEMLERAITTQSNLEELQPWDYTMIGKDGTRIATQVRTRFIWEDGQTVGIQGSARDVSTQKRAEDILRRRDAILESFTFAAEQFLATTDWTENISAVLARLGQATTVSRVYIFENYLDARGAVLSNQRFEWVAPGITPQIANPELQGFDFAAVGFARWIELMSAGKPVWGLVREMSAAEQAVLAAQDIQSFLCVPIFVETQWWGFIGFDECVAERAWSEFEIDSLRTAANTLGAVIARARAQAQADARLNEQTLLLRLSQDLLTLADTQAIVDRVMRFVDETFHPELAHIWLVDEPGTHIQVVARVGWGEDGIAQALTPLSDPVIGAIAWAIQHRQTHVTNDLRSENRLLIPPVAPARDIHSAIVAPMVAGDRALGAISINSIHAHHSTDDHARLLALIANDAAEALERARLFAVETRRARQLETLYQVGQALNSTLDTETILENVTTEALRVTDATHGCLCIADAPANRFWYRALRGYTPELAAQVHAMPLALDHGHNGRAYQTQQIISIDDVTTSPDYVEFVPQTRAELVVPIVCGGQVLGNIDLQSPQVGAFRAANRALLHALANQAGIALENARLFEQAQQRGREQTIVSEVSRALNASLDARQAFPTIAKAIQELTGCDQVSMALLDETNEYFVIAALDSPRAELSQGTRLPVRASAAAADVLGGHTYITPDLQTEQHFPAEHALVQAGFRSRINIPLSVGEWVIGSLNLVSRKLNAFYPGISSPLEQIADAVAIAIENMHLFEAEQTRREELAALYDLARALAELNDIETILNLVAQRAVNTLRITFARIALIEGEHFAVRAGYPARILGRDLRIGQREALTTHPFCAYILAAATPLLLSANDARISELERETFFLGVTKVMCFVPLRLGERVLGFAMLGEVRDERREPFTDEKVRLASSIGDQTASALHRAELFAQIESAYLQTVLALAQATDAKDTYTANHAQRLAEMSTAIGDNLGMTARELEDLRYGATLHDIGKIGVPDAILQKPEALTREEWVLMRKHPITGEQILAPVPRLAGAARIVRHHHERFDGTGYPDELAGNAIPLGARILTLVDSYSAIVDRRVYKKPRSHKAAIAELEQHVGTQFDPRVMEIFLDLFEQNPDPKKATE